MSLSRNDNFKILASKPIDSRYYNSVGTKYVSVLAANAGTDIAVRYEGLELNINNEKYWYKDGISDIDLVKYVVPTAFLELTDVADTDYTEKAGYIAQVNSGETGLSLTNPYAITRQGTYWTMVTGSTSGDPGTDNMILDSATPASVTQINLSNTMDGINLSTVLDNLTDGDPITMIQEDDHEKYLVLTVTGATINQGTYHDIDVVVEESNTLFDDGAIILTSIYFDEQGGGGTGGGHVILENNVSEIQRSDLNFITANSTNVIEDIGSKTTITLTIDSMNDVDISGRNDGDIISYDSTSGHTYEPTQSQDLLLNDIEANINTNSQLTTIVQNGYKIDSIIISEDSSNNAGNISISTTSGYTGDIVSAQTINANDVVDCTLLLDFFSLVNDQDIYISSSVWGSGVVSVYFTFKKMI